MKVGNIILLLIEKTFQGHSNSVLRVSFISSGLQLISSSSDGLLKLWNISTNECVNSFDAHEEKIWALAVRDDEMEIISGGTDSVLKVWQDYTEIEEEEKQRVAETLMLQ